jgi:hypothetical protein
MLRIRGGVCQLLVTALRCRTTEILIFIRNNRRLAVTSEGVCGVHFVNASVGDILF